MVVVALAALAVAAVTAGSSGAIIRSLIRQHGRERQLLIDQLCHLAGRAWTPPPADTFEPTVPTEDLSLVRHLDQYPDNHDFDAEAVK